MEPLLMTVTEAAALVGISRARLYELLASGQVPSIKLGRSRRIALADLEAFVAALRADQLGQHAGLLPAKQAPGKVA